MSKDKSNSTGTKAVGVKLPVELYDRAAERATSADITISDLMRSALAAYLNGDASTPSSPALFADAPAMVPQQSLKPAPDFRLLLGEALVVLLAAAWRSHSEETAVKVVKEIFLSEKSKEYFTS